MIFGKKKPREKTISDLLEHDKNEFYKNMKELEEDMNDSFFYD